MILLLDLYVKQRGSFCSSSSSSGTSECGRRRGRAQGEGGMSTQARASLEKTRDKLVPIFGLLEASSRALESARATHRSSTRSASGHSERAPNRAIQARRRGGAAQLAAICAAHEEAMAALAAQGARGMRLAEERFQGATEVGEHALRAQLEAERAPTHRPLHFEPPSGKRGSRCGFLLRGV